MAKWKCPNTSNVPDHPVKILFEDDKFKRNVPDGMYWQVPTPKYCEICSRYYTRDECIQVGT